MRQLSFVATETLLYAPETVRIAAKAQMSAKQTSKAYLSSIVWIFRRRSLRYCKTDINIHNYTSKTITIVYKELKQKQKANLL